MDSRKSGINSRDDNDKIDHLKQDWVKAASRQRTQYNGKGTCHHTGSDSHEQGTRAALASDPANRFCNDDSGGWCTCQEQEPANYAKADANYNGDQKCSTQRKQCGDDEAKDIILPDGCVEYFLLLLYTFPAAVAGRRVDCTFGTNGTVAVIAAQARLAGGMDVAVEGVSGCLCHLGNPSEFSFI